MLMLGGALLVDTTLYYMYLWLLAVATHRIVSCSYIVVCTLPS